VFHYFENSSFARQVVSVLVCWLLCLVALAMIFHNWWVLELYIFPSAAFIWVLRNENRLKLTRPDLRKMNRSVSVHFFFTVPLLIGIRLVLSIAQAAKEADAWRLMLAMSFGIGLVIVIIYAFAILSRKQTRTGESATAQQHSRP
jgi:hypothetical protein